jgi:hypothetical protein
MLAKNYFTIALWGVVYQEKKEDPAGKLPWVRLCGSLSGSLLLLMLTPGRVWSQTSLLTERATPQNVTNQNEDRKAEGELSQEASEAVGTTQPTWINPINQGEAEDELLEAGFVVGTAHPTRVESDWVTDSLVWLDQAVVAQATLQTTGVQDNSLVLSSSTDSADLQPVESVPAVEDVIQAHLVQPSNIAQATPAQAQSEQWHFLLVPYVYVPFFISGSATYEGSEEFQNNFSRDFDNTGNLDGSRDFEFVPTEIRTSLKNSLNFAFLGEIEAWTPNYSLGILANFDYLSLTSRDTLDRAVRRPGFANFVPTEINASLNTQVWTVDLAASYRFYDRTKVNPQGLDTEFDLGPFVFDAVGGLSVASVNTQLGLSTNLGEMANLQRAIS